MTPSPHARARFGIRFALLARRWRRSLEDHLATIGLTGATWIPLVHLDETGSGIAQKDLAALVGVDASSLVRVLDILEREGLIVRREDVSDRRTRLIDLTEAGRRRVLAIRAELAKAEEAMLSDIADDDIVAMLRHFDLIDRRLSMIQSVRQQDGMR